VHGNAAATVNNIAAHEWLFRVGIIDELIDAVILICLVSALYRLFKELDQHLAVLVVIFGGVMPATIYFVDVVNDAGVLTVVRDGAGFLSVFDEPQRDALAVLFLRLHDFQMTATMLLAGIWLFPLAILVYRSRFLPRFLGIWLGIAGCGYVILFFTGILLPEYENKVFVVCQPAFLGELAFMLWLVIKGAKPSV
jgi:Domain of unknown function (DUF4386)